MKPIVVSLVTLIVIAGCSSSIETAVNGGLGASTSDHFSYIFAGTPFNGLFQSSDLGATWVHTVGFPSLYPMGMAAIGKKLFASSGETIFVSTDDGLHWDQTSFPHNLVWGITVFDSLLIAGTEEGASVSSDEGLTWTTTSTVYATICPRDYAENQHVLFSAGGRGVAHSLDGKAWSQFSGIADCYTIASNESNVFLLTYFAGLLRSDNRGGLWSTVHLPQNDSVAPGTIATSGDALFAGSYSGLFRTTDNGDSWNLVDLGLPKNNISIGGVICKGRYVLVSTAHPGILLSSDTGRTWKAISERLADSTVVFIGVR